MPRKSKRRALVCVRHPSTQLESNGEKIHLLNGTWLEQFWCSECCCIEWYLVQGERESGLSARLARAEEMPPIVGVDGNPSVSEYSKRCSRGDYGVLRYVS